MIRIIAIALFFSILVACGKQPGEPAILKARVAGVTGDVQVNGEAATVGRLLQHGDRLTTGAGARLDLVLQKRGGLTLRENSELILELEPNKIDLKLGRGDLLSSFHRVPASQNVSVVTPTAIAGVRGTHFFVKVHHDDHTYICTCNGRVHKQGHGHAEGEVVEAVHHKAFDFKRNDGKVVRGDAEMLHHEDSHMERNARLIEKELDWEKLH